MRLSQYEINTIKSTFLETFKSGNIYLFGSRVDDMAKGGDIDLYIQSKNNLPMSKIKFLSQLKQKIGDQKIDVIVSKDIKSVIEHEAITKGIML